MYFMVTIQSFQNIFSLKALSRMKIKFSVISFLFFIVSTFSQSYASVKILNDDTLSKWVTNGTSFDFILIDVRNPSELSTSSIIASSSCKPYNFSYNLGAFDSIIPQLPKIITIILYCAAGGRSASAAQKLDAAGFSIVYSLDGGFSNYSSISSRATRPYSEVKPASALPAPSMSKTAITDIHNNDIFPLNSILTVQKNVVRVFSPLHLNHHLSITDMGGKTIASFDNPFLHSPSFTIPRNIVPGTYILSLQGQTNSIIICKTPVIQ